MFVVHHLIKEAIVKRGEIGMAGKSKWWSWAVNALHQCKCSLVTPFFRQLTDMQPNLQLRKRGRWNIRA